MTEVIYQKVKSINKKTVFTVVFLAGLIALAVSMPLVQASHAPDHSASCTLNGNNLIVVDFPADWRLHTAGDQEGPFGVNIPAGRYDVVLQSYDNHSTKVPPQFQPDERWFLQALRGDDIIFQSNPIGDIPESQDRFTQTVNQNVNFNQPISGLIARHASNSLDSNSLQPVCAGFRSTSPPPPPLPSCNIVANPSSILQGQNSTLSWTSQNASSASINQGIGSVALNGSRTVSPSVSTTYTMTVSGSAGTANCQTTVSVTSNPLPSCNITIFPNNISSGASAILSWSSTNATTAFINNGIGTVNTTGNQIVSPTVTTTYVMTVSGAGGSQNCSTTITVDSVPGAVSCAITASPSSIQFGQNSTLSWTSQNASSASINQGIGSVALNGSRTVSPSVSTTYTMTVSGSAGTANCQTTVSVTSNPLPSCNITIFPNNISSGASAILSWSSTNATTAFINNGIGTVNTTGNQIVSPTVTTTYVMTVSGAGGSQNCSTTITVDSVPGAVSCAISVVPSLIQPGQSATLSWTSQNATSASINQGIGSVSLNGSRTVSPTVSTSYILSVSGSGGSNTCQTTLSVGSSSNLPNCSLTVFPTTITRGNSAILSWTSTNANSAFISDGIGSVNTTGNEIVSPTVTTTYTGTFTGSGGSRNCSVTLDVDQSSGNLPSCSLFFSPSSISRGGSATLSWNSQNATRATIFPSIGSVSTSGSRTVFEDVTTTYTGSFTGPGGTRTCSATLFVDDFPPFFGNQSLSITKRVLNLTRGDSFFQDSVTASTGERVKFEIRFNTSGNSSQNNVIVRDILPTGLTRVSGSMRIDGGLEVSEFSLFGSGRNFGSLVAGQTRVITYEATVDGSFSTTLLNTATVRSSQVSERQDSASVSTQVLGIQTSQTQSKSAFNNTRGVNATTVPAQSGDTITYTLTYHNTSSSTQSNVVIEDDILDVMELARVVDMGGATVVDNGVIRYPAVSIAPGGQISRTFQVRVNDPNAIPANSDLLMVNVYGNEVRIPVQVVRGAATPPRTGAGEWVAGIFAGLSTLAYWQYKRRSQKSLESKLTTH